MYMLYVANDVNGNKVDAFIFVIKFIGDNLAIVKSHPMGVYIVKKEDIKSVYAGSGLR